jgi:hypothetical protein
MLPMIAKRILLLIVLLLSFPSAAFADSATGLGGNPLNVFVGERGQLQAIRTDTGSGIFFDSTRQVGDAGFFLAFPSGLPGDATPQVWGFQGLAGPHGLEEYSPVSQTPVTGAGTVADPLKQVTTYSAGGVLTVTQTTTYVNGSQEFRVRWEVDNASPSTVTFKALAAADFYFQGDDAGTGIFTQGPPRFIGGTNLDSGNSGGLAEVSGAGLLPWSAYQALEYGSGPNQVWGKVEESAESSAASFNDTVLEQPADNAGGVEWDQNATAGLASGATQAYEVLFRSAVPSALQLNPTNAGSRQGVPINISATATDSNGVPYAGKTVRYSIVGPNAVAGSTTLNGAGNAVITDPGANAGSDTVVVFVDFNNDGSREAVEPQASAQATFVDSVPPTCSIKVSGTLVGGGGAGKPLVVTVSCGEEGTVKTETTLEPLPGGKARVSKKPVKIKLKPVTVKVKKGKKVPIKIKIPAKVRRKYAGSKMKATIKVTAKDKAGNKKTTKKKTKLKLAPLG